MARGETSKTKTKTKTKTSKKKDAKSKKRLHKKEMIEESDHEHSASASEVPVIVEDDASVSDNIDEVVTQSWADDVSEKHPVDKPRSKPQTKRMTFVTDEPSLPPDSVANFDRADAVEYEKQVASELQIDQLLKLLIRRGEVQFNPALAKGAEKLLRQLNCEQIHPPRNHGQNKNKNGSKNDQRYRPRRRRWNKTKPTAPKGEKAESD